jgi:hypothetical protein
MHCRIVMDNEISFSDVMLHGARFFFNLAKIAVLCVDYVMCVFELLWRGEYVRSG